MGIGVSVIFILVGEFDGEIFWSFEVDCYYLRGIGFGKLGNGRERFRFGLV